MAKAMRASGDGILSIASEHFMRDAGDLDDPRLEDALVLWCQQFPKRF
jgi:hypothetical protein|tara:strand:- start:988 stop:1131 length:144 start_codon:yes stop_codon:yes gene_type:complete